jgi:hypothetical protein
MADSVVYILNSEQKKAANYLANRWYDEITAIISNSLKNTHHILRRYHPETDEEKIDIEIICLLLEWLIVDLLKNDKYINLRTALIKKIEKLCLTMRRKNTANQLLKIQMQSVYKLLKNSKAFLNKNKSEILKEYMAEISSDKNLLDNAVTEMKQEFTIDS